MPTASVVTIAVLMFMDFLPLDVKKRDAAVSEKWVSPGRPEGARIAFH
jgi:hypothetical protein